MRRMTPSIRRRIALAGLWTDMPCLPCGCRSSGIQAEHALYETGDGRQGMGAPQLNEAWAIIPACPSCNFRGVKRMNAYCALLTGEALSALSPPQEGYLRLLKEEFAGGEYDGLRSRVARWTAALKEAGHA